jgi:hypothetical protein
VISHSFSSVSRTWASFFLPTWASHSCSMRAISASANGAALVLSVALISRARPW